MKPPPRCIKSHFYTFFVQLTRKNSFEQKINPHQSLVPSKTCHNFTMPQFHLYSVCVCLLSPLCKGMFSKCCSREPKTSSDQLLLIFLFVYLPGPSIETITHARRDTGFFFKTSGLIIFHYWLVFSGRNCSQFFEKKYWKIAHTCWFIRPLFTNIKKWFNTKNSVFEKPKRYNFTSKFPFKNNFKPTISNQRFFFVLVCNKPFKLAIQIKFFTKSVTRYLHFLFKKNETFNQTQPPNLKKSANYLSTPTIQLPRGHAPSKTSFNAARPFTFTVRSKNQITSIWSFLRFLE